MAQGVPPPTAQRLTTQGLMTLHPQLEFLSVGRIADSAASLSASASCPWARAHARTAWAQPHLIVIGQGIAAGPEGNHHAGLVEGLLDDFQGVGIIARAVQKLTSFHCMALPAGLSPQE